MRCACDACNELVVSDGELCRFCSETCYPPTADRRGRITRTREERLRLHLERVTGEKPPPSKYRKAFEKAADQAVEELLPIAQKLIFKKLGEL